MAAPTETTKPITDSGAESPTTARPLDLDDDDVQETGIISEEGNISTGPTSTPATKSMQATVEDEGPKPPKPQRPPTEAQTNELILKEAFPTVENSVIKAVLRASGGKVEPAFNALLEMTDPDAVKNEPEESAPPPPPPRPTGPRAQMSQLEADELYARQLAEHYNNVGAYEARTSSRNPDGRPRPRAQQGYGEEDREHSFIDDDLPVIRDNLRKGFMETQKQVNGWINNIRKKIEENFDESEQGGPSGQGHQGQQQYGSYARQGQGRRSGDYHKYDADPQVLSDDFAGMKFAADGTPVNQQTSGIYRPPQSSSPAPGTGRRVGFKEEADEINMYDTSPKVPPKDAPSSGTKASKWQPLSSVDPNPIGDNDPFSLGDSEDEKDTKDAKEKPKDGKADESERLKQAAAEAMADSLVDPAKENTAAKKS
ncbi:hypothetical protein NLU13_7029 [Sarocladium strictum]|uniref:CUE domain-containing protein n=1 Tax=Sarocladium strictum TaxID=5046 RepID=A0AA39GEI3_SARSR|nr:hypothetical protein NLU13_7029 [Sarocladium strictum]